jgi:hypothetical protein
MGESSFQIDTVIKIQKKGTYKTTIEAIDKKPVSRKAETEFIIQ